MHLLHGSGSGILGQDTPESEENPLQSLVGLFWGRVVCTEVPCPEKTKIRKEENR